MVTSTDGQLCFGILVDELPWDNDDSINDWWREVNNCPINFRDDGDSDDYYSRLFKWDDENPIPVIVVNYQSGDYPAWILAVPASFRSCSRGHPLRVDPDDLWVTAGEVQKLFDFCERFDIEITETAWYLSSYWG